MKNRCLHLSLYAPCVKHNLLKKQKTKKINFQSERNNHSTVQLWYLHNHSYGFYYSGFPHHCVLFFFFYKDYPFFFSTLYSQLLITFFALSLYFYYSSFFLTQLSYSLSFFIRISAMIWSSFPWHCHRNTHCHCCFCKCYKILIFNHEQLF